MWDLWYTYLFMDQTFDTCNILSNVAVFVNLQKYLKEEILSYKFVDITIVYVVAKCFPL